MTDVDRRRRDPYMFNWLFNYIVYYLLGLVLAIAGLVASYVWDVPQFLRILLWLVLIAWALSYHVILIRWQVRRLREYCRQIAAHVRGRQRLSHEQIVAMAMDLGGDQLGMPEFLLSYFIKKFYPNTPSSPQ